METNLKISDKAEVKQAAVTPQHIMQIGMGFWASKTLLAAIRFGLFTLLAEKRMTALQIKEQLGLHERAYDDFLDALVSLNFLNREGDGMLAIYSNATDTNIFLDRNKPTYIGGILEMANNRLYQYWGSLDEALITGKPQNENKNTDSENAFQDLYSNQEKMKEFLNAMAGIQMGAFMAFAAKFDFSPYQLFCDIGGASGALSIQVAKQNEHMKCVTYDLPEVSPVAKAMIDKHHLNGRIETASGNFFRDDFPKADIITMGNILHDWSEHEKLQLIKKAYDALLPGGALVCIENIIDDERRTNTFGLLMSLNMLIETKEGKDFTFEEFKDWGKQCGFTKFQLMPLAGPTSAAIAFK
jgi:hypothetical protein